MEITPKDLRAIAIFQKMKLKSLKDDLDEFHLMVDTLFYLQEALNDEMVEIDYKLKFAETLLMKFCFHSLSIHNILSGLTLSSVYFKENVNGKSIIDISSSKVILRSQLEAFLMYHHIFVNPGTEDLKELRYNAWIYSSLLQRQQFPATTEVAKKQKEIDLISLSELEKKIESLSSYQKLTERQKKQLLEKGSGKLFNHWSTMLKETGFTEGHIIYQIYGYLSMYSHSEGISIMQLDPETGKNGNVKDQACLDVYYSKLLICCMMSSIANMFEVINKRYMNLPADLRFDIELYTTIAKSK